MKGTGLLNMLHDQCRTPGASDKTFALAMYERCSAHSRFEADSRQVAQQLFSIHHFAGIVQYDIDGFVEKNRDELPKEGADLLLSSSNGFVKTLAEILQPSEASAKKLLTSPRGGASQQRPTVGVQFSSQLQSLRLKIDETSPHYIRCLKPNNQLVPDLFDAALVADQLRCAGVIEAVRVSRLGYPHRYSHSRFIERYRSLGLKALGKKKTKKYNPTKALVHAISDQLGDSRGIQVGKSKVFLRRGTYDAIEKLRREKISSSTVRIQSFVSRAVYRQRFAKIRSSIIVIQSSIRIFKARRELSNRRRQHNSVILQRAWRRYSSVTRFTSAKAIARWCQVHQRGAVGRAEYNALNRVRHALCIQRYWRGYASLIAFRHQVYAAIVLQCTRRSCIARRKLSLLKSDSKKLSSVAEERDRFRGEAASLRRELQKMKQEKNACPDGEMKSLDSTLLSDKDTEIASFRIALDHMSFEKDSAVKDLADMKQINKSLQVEINEKESTYKRRLEELSDKVNLEFNDVSAELRRVKDERDQAIATMETLKRSRDVERGSSAMQSNAIGGIYDDTESDLRAEIKSLKESNLRLNEDNTSLQNRVRSLRGIAASTGKHKKEDVYKANSVTIGHDALIPSVCTSFTAEMTETEEELVKLREENQILRKQLELLRVNQGSLPDILDSSDQEYEESVNPGDSDDDSNATSDSGSTERVSTELPMKLMRRICPEVEEANEEVIIKTRAESAKTIAKLQHDISTLTQELEKAKKQAQYNLDDMKRVNRSLREELEQANEELDAKCEEFDALNEDVDKFAETFATQSAEMERLERQLKKAQLENERLKSSAAISSPVKGAEAVTEGKAWEELKLMREEMRKMTSTRQLIDTSSPDLSSDS